jgi:CHAT domain-containing protein/tetratricopeptide (TPR) repeat protein
VLLSAGSSEAAEALRFQPGRACKLSPGIADVYVFTLKKGDFQRLVFDQRGLDIKVEVFDPRSQRVVLVDGMGSRGPEDVSWVAASTGKYQVKVSSGDEGIYTLQTAVHRRATPEDRDRADAAIVYLQGKELKSKDTHEAEVRFRDAVRLAGRAKDRLREADAWNQIGFLQCGDNRWSECRDSLARALSLYEALGQRMPGVLSRMAMVLESLGETTQAAAAYERCIRFTQELGMPGDEANARLKLGGLQLDGGKIDQALVNLQAAAKLYHQQSKPSGEAHALMSSGRAYSKLGEIDEALAVQDKALKALRGSKDQAMIASAYSHLGDTYREAGQYEQAVAYYHRALGFSRHLKDRESEASTSSQLGLAYFRLKKYREAREAFRQALKIFHERQLAAKEANVLINLGSIEVALHSIPKAIEYLQQALSVNRRLKRLDTEAAAYFQLAWAERRRNRPAVARTYAAHALEILESMRSANQKPDVRATVLGQWQPMYELQVELLMEQHRLERMAGHDVEAFDLGEHARARTLLESLGERSSPTPLGLRQIQRQVVDQDTVLLAYSLGDERSYLWVVTPQEYSSFELPGREQIEPLAREVSRLLPRSHFWQERDAAVRQARALSQILLGPVAQRLGNKRLLIVTPAELQYVPFAALPDLAATELAPEPDGGWPVPLIVHHEIVSAPSASVIAALREQRAGRPKPPNLLALVADPVYELNGVRPLAGRFKQLPSSRIEAEAIARLAGGETVLKLFDYDANRDRVADRLGAYRILHFSVHGDPNRSHPDLSALVLSAFAPGGKQREPFLRARDIQEMNLPADLAVLSACGTGLGMEVRGEGLMGLTQAFFTAGTSSMVVSLWDVDNTATERLMRLFYLELLKNGLRPAAALREAQIRMWRHQRWNAPSNWAGFIEQGEWRSM